VASAKDCRQGANNDDPQHRPSRDPTGLRGFGAFRDADDQQRDDERNDRHLERIQPPGADERRNAECGGPGPLV
jgi:hypothetical protein